MRPVSKTILYPKRFCAEPFWIQEGLDFPCCHGHREKPPFMSFPTPTHPVTEGCVSEPVYP